MNTNFWTEQAGHLEAALLANVDVLAEHFLRTAPAEAVWNLAGDQLPHITTHDGVKATLYRQLRQPAAVVVDGCFWSEMAAELKNSLLENPRAMTLHYLQTAPEAALWGLAGGEFAYSIGTRDGVKATLAKQLMHPIAIDGTTLVH